MCTDRLACKNIFKFIILDFKIGLVVDTVIKTNQPKVGVVPLTQQQVTALSSFPHFEFETS